MFNRKYWVLAEAFGELLWAHLALRCLPYKRIMAKFGCMRPAAEIQGRLRHRRIATVERMTEKASRILPWPVVCFPKALAVWSMLRRRDIMVTLYYGARIDPDRVLRLHVWLQDGARGIVGHPKAGEFKVLARYPAEGEGALKGNAG